MLMPSERQILVCRGGPRPTRFKYLIERDMTKEIADWLDQTYKGGYGSRYYYSHGEIWFKQAKQETLFLLRWS